MLLSASEHAVYGIRLIRMADYERTVVSHKDMTETKHAEGERAIWPSGGADVPSVRIPSP